MATKLVILQSCGVALEVNPGSEGANPAACRAALAGDGLPAGGASVAGSAATCRAALASTAMHGWGSRPAARRPLPSVVLLLLIEIL